MRFTGVQSSLVSQKGGAAWELLNFVILRPCTRSCGFEASETIPIPGADSIFSSRCGAISGRLRFAVAVARTSELCAKPPTLLRLRYEFRTGLQPVRLDETGLPLFQAQAAFRGTNGFLGCFAASPRNDDPARSEAAGGREPTVAE